MVEIPRGRPDAARDARFTALATAVDTAVKAHDLTRAIALATTAIGEGFAHPVFFNLLAYRDMQEGRPAEALKLLRNALALAPNDVNLHNMAGVCEARLGDHAAAIRSFDAALATVPDFPPAVCNRGVSLEAQGDRAGARDHFLRAVALDPQYAEALARLAYSEMLRGDAAAARGYAQRALRLNPQEQLAGIVAASADIAEGVFDRAASRALDLLGNNALTATNRIVALGLMGDAFDGAGKLEGAFKAYEEASLFKRRLYEPTFGKGTALTEVRSLRTYFDAAAPAFWHADRSAPADPQAALHVFLVGFPRSGTTLLEQALASRADVVTSEEHELFDTAARDLLHRPEGIQTLATLPAKTAAEYGARYWQRAAQAGLRPGGKLFVDKLPLNSIRLPLVAKIFPHAKIVFALRDPRDVVFSCFRRRFGMNRQMYQLITLDGAATYYDAVMSLCELYRAKLGLDWHDIRHETVIGDFPAEMRVLCGFLDIAWDDAMAGFAERVRGRAVDTPSGVQLARGLTAQGAGSWRRYESQLAGVMPRLMPWVQRFHYGEG